jgi:DNA-binding response OmpR family regulator
MTAHEPAQDQTVLIVSTDPLLAALLGLLVELQGHRPVFDQGGESPAEALARHHPRLVLVDADHHDGFSAAFLERARRSGAGVVVFSPGRPDGEVRQLARERGLVALALPTDRVAFRRTLGEALGGSH